MTERISKIVRVVPRNRNTELVLLLFAIGLNAFELLQVELSTMSKVTPDFWLYFGPLALSALALHLVLRLRAREADPLILPIVVTLNGLGIAEIYRLDIAAIANKQTELNPNTMVNNKRRIVIFLRNENV